MWPRDFDDLGGLGGGGRGSEGNVSATPEDLLGWYTKCSCICSFLFSCTFVLMISVILAVLVSSKIVHLTWFIVSVSPVKSVQDSMEDSWLAERDLMEGEVKFLDWSVSRGSVMEFLFVGSFMPAHDVGLVMSDGR